jgi:class 3 adenylate cyclase
VTVLFADVVGSTKLGEQLSPDEAKALIGECVTQMSRAVEEFGGTIQAIEGDGICAYFGVPQAHEDDPERAARAAVRIIEVVGAYARDVAAAWGIPDFSVRVGVNTGRAGVGPVGGGAPQTVALGDATNVAARLERVAAPGTIAVGEETSRRLAQRFTFESLGDVAVKGRAEPVAAARLVAARAPARQVSLRPLVGREREAEALRAIAAELHAGRGNLLLLVGEAGIGKTRLLAELRLLAGEVAWLEGQSLAYGGLPSSPFVDALLRWLGVGAGDPEVVLRTRARAKLGADFAGLGQLLGISDGGAHVTSAYLAWLEALATQGPVALALEDLHRADASTRELAEAVIALTDRLPLLLVATLRRDPASEAWRFRTRVLADFAHRTTELSLAPLAPDDAALLLGALLPGAFDEAARAELLARAEGNPLYLEELLRALVEGGGLERKHRTWTTTLRPSAVLPPTLESLLVARIDRLPEGPRRLAQLAAVVGREFPVAALERLAGASARDDLTGLLRAEIVRELRRYPELVCAFRHGLLQEAALATLTPARRRDLYAEVAAAVEELYPDEHERLAHYHAQAGRAERA